MHYGIIDLRGHRVRKLFEAERIEGVIQTDPEKSIEKVARRTASEAGALRVQQARTNSNQSQGSMERIQAKLSEQTWNFTLLAELNYRVTVRVQGPCVTWLARHNS